MAARNGKPIIVIDGQAGSGKTEVTSAVAIARQHDGMYLPYWRSQDVPKSPADRRLMEHLRERGGVGESRYRNLARDLGEIVDLAIFLQADASARAHRLSLNRPDLIEPHELMKRDWREASELINQPHDTAVIIDTAYMTQYDVARVVWLVWAMQPPQRPKFVRMPERATAEFELGALEFYSANQYERMMARELVSA